MAWTTPRTWVAAETVNETIMNQHVRDNLNYLKGAAGVVTMEAGIASDTTNTDDLGTSAIRWKSIFGINSWGNRFLVSRHRREIGVNWENQTAADWNVDDAVSGTGTIDDGGTGQIVLTVANDSVGTARIDQWTEQASGADNAWTVTKNPYFRCEFHPGTLTAQTDMFIGFRQTPTAALPTTTNYAGLYWDGTTFEAATNDGGATDTSTDLTAQVTTARHVIEIAITSATNVEYWLDGVLRATHTTDLPTGTLEWQILVESDGAGAATSSIFTLGRIAVQEDL